MRSLLGLSPPPALLGPRPNLSPDPATERADCDARRAERKPGSTGRAPQIGMRGVPSRRRRRAPQRAYPLVRERGAEETTPGSAASAPEMPARAGGFGLRAATSTRGRAPVGA